MKRDPWFCPLCGTQMSGEDDKCVVCGRQNPMLDSK